MKVLMINGSPHPNGNTATALSEMARIFQQEGIETEYFHGLGEGRTVKQPCEEGD